jgi:hypothetical protein
MSELCPLLGVHQTSRFGVVTAALDPLRKSATGSGSGSGRLVVEIVGGVTEVSLHVRYGGISGLGRPPIKQMFEPIGCSLLSRATPSRR